MTMSDLERIAILETRFDALRQEILLHDQSHREDVKNVSDKIEDVSKKLEELLTLKNKGLGAFWLVSILTGTGLISFITMLITWIKG